MVDVEGHGRHCHDIARVDDHVVAATCNGNRSRRRVDRRARGDGPSGDGLTARQLERVDETGVAGSDEDARALAVECRDLGRRLVDVAVQEDLPLALDGEAAAARRGQRRGRVRAVGVGLSLYGVGTRDAHREAAEDDRSGCEQVRAASAARSAPWCSA